MSKNGFKDDKKNQLIENKQIDQNETKRYERNS